MKRKLVTFAIRWQGPHPPTLLMDHRRGGSVISLSPGGRLQVRVTRDDESITVRMSTEEPGAETTRTLGFLPDAVTIEQGDVP